MSDRDALGNSYDDGLTLVLKGPDGERTDVKLSCADLASPERMRATWYAATGVEMPHYSQEDHLRIVRVMMRLAGYVEAPPPGRPPPPRRRAKRKGKRRR